MGNEIKFSVFWVCFEVESVVVMSEGHFPTLSITKKREEKQLITAVWSLSCSSPLRQERPCWLGVQNRARTLGVSTHVVFDKMMCSFKDRLMRPPLV